MERPNVRNLTYDINDLYQYLDSLADLGCLMCVSYPFILSVSFHRQLYRTSTFSLLFKILNSIHKPLLECMEVLKYCAASIRKSVATNRMIRIGSRRGSSPT